LWSVTRNNPQLFDRGIPPHVWYADYVATYIERDLRQLINVRDLAAFQRFLRMCAARTGQMLNLSALAADCGITHNTAKIWISILEASYLVVLLPPWHRNLGKRLYFWRDSTGNEVDLLVEHGPETAFPIECKAGRTVAADWFKPLQDFCKASGASASALIYGGQENQSRSQTPVFGWDSMRGLIALAFQNGGGQ
jgi:predicted AAA+ superfamily ATPase